MSHVPYLWLAAAIAGAGLALFFARVVAHDVPRVTHSQSPYSIWILVGQASVGFALAMFAGAALNLYLGYEWRDGAAINIAIGLKALAMFGFMIWSEFKQTSHNNAVKDKC